MRRHLRLKSWQAAAAAVVLAVSGAGASAQGSPQAQAPQPSPPGPPATDVYLVSLAEPALWTAEAVVNISDSPGYDNQPSFMRDSRSVLFTSNRDGQQSDIYRYWIADRKLTRLTETAESEYSATVVPAGNGFSVIQVEADGTQRLWQFSFAARAGGGLESSVVLPDVKPVGYHAWIDADTVMVFVLGEPATLQRAAPGSPLTETVAGNIGRSLVAIPGTRAVSFTTRDENGVWWIKRYDADTREVTTIIHAVEGDGEPHTAWSRDGRLFTASGTRIFMWKAGAADWTPIGDLTAAPVQRISRLAVSPDARWLAFVAEPRTEHPAPSTSTEQKH
jgi:hypothetical protein